MVTWIALWEETEIAHLGVCKHSTWTVAESANMNSTNTARAELIETVLPALEDR